MKRTGHAGGWLVGGLCAVLFWTGSSSVRADELAAQPLAPRSGPAAATLFTPLTPAQTGIITENSYADSRMWAEQYQELAYGAMGTGVAIADYDNDGRPDVFVVSKTGQSRLFRNLGGWKFEDVTARAGFLPVETRLVATSHWSQGAAFADVNNDGWLDLYVCRFAAPNLLFVNRGDGTFREEAAARGLAVVDASGMAAFCDYDRDGWLDVYVQTSLLDAVKAPKGQRDYLFHNKRDGTFEDVTAAAGIRGESMGHSATWWDFDNDGWPDVYVANDYDTPDRAYRNNRDGTFSDVINTLFPRTSYYSMGSDLGDVNNDGRSDLMVADMAATSHEKDQRGMAGSRSRAQLDGTPPGAVPQHMRNALYLNTGTGRMLEAARLAGFPATDWTWSLRFEDLDNDGRLDLHVTNGMSREYHNADLLERIMGLEDPTGSRRMMKAMPAFAETNLAYHNDGDLKFTEVGKAWGLDQTGVSFGTAFGDLDGDGDLDLVFANFDAPATILRNDSPGGHCVVFALRGTVSNRFGVGATVRLETAAAPQVRTLVLARGYLSNSEPVLHFGLGADEQIRRVTVEWPSGHVQEFTALAADRKYTITEPSGQVERMSDVAFGSVAPNPLSLGNNGSERIEGNALHPRDSAGKAQYENVAAARGLSVTLRDATDSELPTPAFVPWRFDRRGPALAAGDLNGDGKDDVVFGGTMQEPAQLLLAREGGGFADPVKLPATPLDDGPVVLFDADGDGDNDLLETKAGANRAPGSPDFQPQLWLNDGQGKLTSAPAGALPAFPLSAGAAAVADFDRDGKLDVFLGARLLPGKYPLPPRSALLGNRGGKFEDVTDTLAPILREVGMVTSALWSDVDGDGWVDLVLSLEWGGVKYFHNDEGKAFTDRSEQAGFAAAGTGWWTSLASADFNGDGRPDFVAGNQGLNSIYQADAAHPALLYSGRFGSGPPQLIEAYYEGDKIYPRRTRNDLGMKIPVILKKYPKNDDYAKATLGEILGEDKLAAAQRFAATELRSGVFLSQADGAEGAANAGVVTYRFSPLPRIAQISPFQGVAAGDFDGDGFADIYAVQNSHAPIALIGRFEGGVSQLLRGDGRGNFTPVEPVSSGLVVPGDAKALALLDFDADGWPDFLVSRNGAASLAWRNGGAVGRHSFAVRLQGPTGNATGIGARIVVELTDGTRQTAEVQAGSGYYSQPSSSLFFGYADGNLPEKITVHWPDGATTERVISPPVPALVVVGQP